MWYAYPHGNVAAPPLRACGGEGTVMVEEPRITVERVEPTGDDGTAGAAWMVSAEVDQFRDGREAGLWALGLTVEDAGGAALGVASFAADGEPVPVTVVTRPRRAAGDSGPTAVAFTLSGPTGQTISGTLPTGRGDG